MKFKCPYCFQLISDDEVLFRSEKVDLRSEEEILNILPGAYDEIDMFEEEYEEDDKESYLKQYREWEKYRPQSDPVYEKFWEKYQGTTEHNRSDEILGVEAFHRHIISPYENVVPELKKQDDGTYILRDADGMVSEIEFETGERCKRRVCPHCHNPLPVGYGKNPVRFITVIGIAGTGKTVFLSQLLKNMGTYCTKAGLSAFANSPSVQNFLKENVIATDVPLPGSTPHERFQQPLFFETVREEGDRRNIETIVFYDVAGEVFTSDTIENFAPFVKHADGVMVLIDPLQFEAMGQIAKEKKEKPVTALRAIHKIISQGEQGKKCEIPFAICISQADSSNMQKLLGAKIVDLLLEEISGIPDRNGYNQQVFNAECYRPLEIELRRFFLEQDPELAYFMRKNYASYSFFAFSALGEEGEEKEKENGEKYVTPTGNVMAKRIEEPLLWLFYKFGYIDGYGYDVCPGCGSRHVKEFPKGMTVKEKSGFFKWKTVERRVDRECKECGYQWDSQETHDTYTEDEI